MATQSNLYVDQGTDYRVTIGVASNDDGFDFDEWEFSAGAAKLYSSTTAIVPVMTKIYADSENPINSVEMYISADQTVDLEPGKYVYDVIMTNVDTEEHDKILEGLIFILQSITRPYSDEQ
jgi:hypothetical protein